MKWHEMDGEEKLMLLGTIVLVLSLILSVMMSIKEEDYKHEIELKKIELCGEEEE